MKPIGFFDEIMQKRWFKIRVGKLMKIFFIRNVVNNIALSLKKLPVMPLSTFPRKTMIFAWVFTFSDYCGASYSKYIHGGVTLQKRALLVRVKSQK